MMKATTLRARPKQFRSFTGFTVEQFDRMVILLEPLSKVARRERLATGRTIRKRDMGGGRKYALEPFADRLLLVIVWSRLYLVFFILEHLFGVDESTICRTIKEILPLLQTQYVFIDPRKSGRKKIGSLEELKKIIPDLDEILADATEQAILRPEKKRKRNKHHSGKKKRFTLKTQIAVRRNDFILHVSNSVPGRQHDYKLFKETYLARALPKGSTLYVDSGYQGIEKDFPTLMVKIPVKRTRSKSELTRSEKIRNHKQRKTRIFAEHTIARLKKFRVLADTYRHSQPRYNQTFRFVANLVNFRLLYPTG